VLDSRGNPTLEVEVFTAAQAWGRAFVPSGASTGRAEACELRDEDPQRYDGRGVLKAVANVLGRIAPAVIGLDPADQSALDRRLLELDPTPRKTLLGGNTLLGVSLATAHAGAAVTGRPLFEHLHSLSQASRREHFHPEVTDSAASGPAMPLAMTNMISGGLHAGGNLDFQDFLVLPIGAPSMAVGLEWIVRVHRRLGQLLSAAGYEGRLVADEGGYGPRLVSNRQAAEFIVAAIEAAGLSPGREMALAIDVASTHFFDGSHYRLAATGDRRLTSLELVDELAELVDSFPIVSLEDGLAEDDWSGWQALTARLSSRVQLVGDDLFTTNPERLLHGIELGAANSVLVKVNQIGTLSETFRTIQLARSAGYSIVVSARSGETEDTTIADLAVAVAAEQIKIGSITRSERLAKYNRLLAIEERLAKRP
jgi:enolase